jgi:hypothetical protein
MMEYQTRCKVQGNNIRYSVHENQSNIAAVGYLESNFGGRWQNISRNTAVIAT